MESNRRKACALVRVSTEEQAKGGYGLKFQEEDIRKFCERNNLKLLRVFRDEGYSGGTANRPGFREMMEWARERRFDVLVVWKLDRLFRDTKLTLQTVDELATLDIEFRSVQEAFTHDSNGRFLLTIFAAGAEKERKDINLRMYSGRTAAAKRGVFVNGISTPAYGYSYNAVSKKLEVAKDEAKVVRQIFRWFVDDKFSLYRIQQQLNDMHVPTKYDRLGRKKRTGTTGWWHKRTIGRILENEIYTGCMMLRKYKSAFHTNKEANLRPREDWITIATPRIIPDQTFGLAQAQLIRNAAESPRNTKKLYLLAKLLICGNDNKRLLATTMPSGKNGAAVRYYYCNGMNKANAPVPCHSGYFREDRMVSPLWEKLKELLSNPSVVLRQLADYQKERTMASNAEAKRKALESAKNKTEQQLRRLAEVYIRGAVDKEFYDREYQRLRGQADEQNRELRRVEALVVSTEQIRTSAETIQQLYSRYREKLDSASDDVRREVFRTFVNSIVVRGDELEMEVNLPHAAAIGGQPFSRVSRNSVPPLFLKARLLPEAPRNR